MEIKDELKETDIKNCACYYFDDIIKKREILILLIFYYTKNCTKIFPFMTFHTKLQQAQNYCVLSSIKQMDSLGFVVMNLDI